MPEIKVPVQKFLDGLTQWQKQILKDFDKQSARFFLINWHRRARKTTLAINILIRECVANPKSRYGYITSTYRAAKNIVWRDPNMLKSYLPTELVKKFNDTELFVEFKNGSILSLHGSDDPDSLRGVDFSGVVIDEWPLVKKEVWEEIIRPIISQDIKRWAIFIFTPKGKNHAYHYWIKTKENTEWKTYILRASESGILLDSELAKMKIEVPERVYAQEMECEFNDDASSVFRGVSNCVSGSFEAPQRGSSYVTGVDLARTEDYTVLATMCRETKHLVDFQRFNMVDWSLQKEKIIETARKYNSQVCIDASGVGDPIVQDLKQAGVSIPDSGIIKFTNETKKQLIERLIVSIEQRLITFPKVDVLLEELSAFGYELTPGGYVRYTAPEGYHDDAVIALSLAVHGVRNFLYSRSVASDRPRQTLITGGVY